MELRAAEDQKWRSDTLRLGTTHRLFWGQFKDGMEFGLDGKFGYGCGWVCSKVGSRSAGDGNVLLEDRTSFGGGYLSYGECADVAPVAEGYLA